MGSLINKRIFKKDAVIQRHTQAGKISTNIKVNMEFTLTEIGATKTVTWKFIWMNPLRENIILSYVDIY